MKIEMIIDDRIVNFLKKVFRIRHFIPVLVLLAIVKGSMMIHAAVTIPHTFTDGTTIYASEVNENFSYIIARLWDKSGSDLVAISGNVGIGTSSPSEKLEVNGNVSIGGVTYGHQRFTDSTWIINNTIDVVHGLGATPLLYQVKAKLKVAISTYAIGDEIVLDSTDTYTATNNYRGISIGTNSTNFHIRTGEIGIIDIPTGMNTAVPISNNTEADIIIDVFAWGTP